MKINRKYLVLRILSFPIKLCFTILWFIFIGIIISLKWLIHGGQELYYGNDNGKSLELIINQNKELLKALAENKANTEHSAEARIRK